MSNILHTKNKWTAAACFILGLMLVLMLSTAIFFTVTLGLLDLRGPEWKWVRISPSPSACWTCGGRSGSGCASMAQWCGYTSGNTWPTGG